VLDVKLLRENPAGIEARLRLRGEEYPVRQLLGLDSDRRNLLGETEGMKKELNAASAGIGKLKKEGRDTEAEQARMKDLSKKIRDNDSRLKEIEENIRRILLTVPNVPHPSVPVGKGEGENPPVRTWGEKPAFSFPVRSHVDLGERLGILDFQRASKIAGSRFALLKGKGALLERALIWFMLDVHTREFGYTEVLPPFLVNPESLVGTGQLPKFEEDLFEVNGGRYYLIPTAEVPVTNIHRDEILSADELPIRYVAYTPCFRSEAGSYGKDTQGMIRQHQFNKVELVKFTLPETSYNELESLTGNAEEILRRLGLHYRVVELCTGDLGFAAAKTYDLEVWIPSQDTYREISSCSNFEDYQARRASIRFKRDKKSKTEFVHTLNGSGLAVGRLVVAILENFQREDGTVQIPQPLQTYMDQLQLID
jgi:seryl-tRNA synthetase